MVASCGGTFICSKLRQNPSEMEVRTFIRMQRVIWDHLLAFKGEISQKPFRAKWWILILNYRIGMLSVLLFLSFSFLARRGYFCRLNHVMKVRKRCSYSRFSSQAIILGFFDRNKYRLMLFVFFLVAMGDCGYFIEWSNARWKKHSDWFWISSISLKS